jgi:hypothetical protein
VNEVSENLPSPARARRKPFDLTAALARRAPIVLGLGTLLSFATIPVCLGVVKPKYSASAVLLVDATKEVAINGKERDLIPGDIGDYTRTQIGRMKSVTGISEALRSLPEKARPNFCNPQTSEISQAVQLLKRLVIQEVPRSHLINLKLESDEPRFLGDALNAVVDGFIARLHIERERQNEKRIEYLQTERTRIVERIDQEHRRLLAHAEGMANRAFLHENYSVHLNKVEQIQKLFLEADAERIARQAALQKALSDQSDIQKLSLQPYADERVADNFGINRIEQYTYEQLQQMRVTVDGLTHGNQDRKYVEERMASMNRYLDEYKVRVNEATMRNLEQKRAYDLQSEVIRAESGLASAKSRALELGTILSAAAAEASSTSEAIFNASSVAYSIRELRERLTAINNRIDDCELEAKASVKLAVDSRASNPTVPASSTKVNAFAGGIGLAYGCALLCCIGFEFFDTRLRSRPDIEAALGGHAPDPVLAWNGAAPHDDPGADSLERDIVRSFRSLASRIERERSRHNGRVILLTGVHHGAGTSFVTHQLAAALSDYSDRILLIQTSAADPGNQAALGRLIPEATCKILVERIPQSRSGAAIELGSRIRNARESFDLILIDADPIAVEPFTRFVVLHADVAVVVAKAGFTLFQDLVGVLDEIRRHPIGAMSALLNFAPNIKRVGVQRRIQDAIVALSRFAKRIRGLVGALGSRRK